LNSILHSCITWDMDKIIYTCSAEYMGYHFSKRKWWDFSKNVREMQMEWMEIFSGEEVCVQMRIMEYMEGEFHIRIPPAFYREIWQEFIGNSCKRKKYETLLLVDPLGNCFPKLLSDNVEDVNYLAVLTQKPEAYQNVMEELEQEFGLFGMVFTEYRDFIQYQRQICEGKDVLVFMGSNSKMTEGDGRRVFYRFSQRSLVLDFDEASAYQKMLKGKRMENDYASIAIFLDNIIKNRYNSVVNEGLQMKKEYGSYLQQNVFRTDDKNKLGGKRKGIKKWKKRRIF